jgi:hypothetical protein
MSKTSEPHHGLQAACIPLLSGATTWRNALTLLVLAHTLPASAQLAPSGYTGALNTPTADVLDTGHAQMALTNNNPEKTRPHPGVGGFGSLNLGFGVLPGLELVGRLAFEGDLQCNMYLGDCRSSMRDLSVGGKYQLPLPFELPFKTRLAVGVTDVGGAATNFRQSYGVASSRIGFTDLSLGYSRAASPDALMRGTFGSAVVHLRDDFQLVLEHDTRQARAGARYQLALTEQTRLLLSASTQRQAQGSEASSQQRTQFGVALNFALEKAAQRSSQPPPSAMAAPGTQTLPPAAAALPQNSPPPTGGVSGVGAVAPEPQLRADRLAAELRALGFTNIRVGLKALDTSSTGESQAWWVIAEPLSWRKSQAQALGKVLGAWLKQPGHAADSLTLALSYLQQPATAVFAARRDCLQAFGLGQDRCGASQALQVLSNTQLPGVEQVQWLVDGSNTDRLHPRLAFGPAMRYTVGTEYGLFDYALGLDTGWEIPLAKGLVWQGYHTTPLSNSTDFEPGKIFANSQLRRQVQTSVLTYVAQPLPRLWVQGSAGKLTPIDSGVQLDAHWFSENGRLRVSGLAGRYPRNEHYVFKPQLAQLRYSVLPGRWFVEATAGQFFLHDQGFKLASNHWFDDYRLSFYLRQSASPGGYRMPKTRFAGISVSIPFGPRESAQIGPLNLRTRDQWSLGLETKIGEDDNYLTGGYGLIPQLRHGLADVTDFDRAGPAGLWAQRQRIRAAMN